MGWHMGLNSTDVAVNDTSYFIKVVTAQNQISRAVYVFSLVQLVGLLAGAFVLGSFVRDWLWGRGTEPGEKFLAWQAGADLLLVLLSLSGLVRPQALDTGPAGCAALSFFVNVFYLHGQLSPVVLVAVAVASLVNGAFRPLAVCVSAAASLALLGSALLAGLLGTPEPQYPIAHYNCHVDPLEATQGYTVTKFCLGLVLPLTALGVLTYALLRSRGRGDREWLAAAPIMAVALPFLCRLVYNIFLLCRPLYQAGDPHFQHRAELLVTVGEMLMFGGSCLALVSHAALRWLRQEQTLAILRHAFGPSQATNTW